MSLGTGQSAELWTYWVSGWAQQRGRGVTPHQCPASADQGTVHTSPNLGSGTPGARDTPGAQNTSSRLLNPCEFPIAEEALARCPKTLERLIMTYSSDGSYRRYFQPSHFCCKSCIYLFSAFYFSVSYCCFLNSSQAPGGQQLGKYFCLRVAQGDGSEGAGGRAPLCSAGSQNPTRVTDTVQQLSPKPEPCPRAAPVTLRLPQHGTGTGTATPAGDRDTVGPSQLFPNAAEDTEMGCCVGLRVLVWGISQLRCKPRKHSDALGRGRRIPAANATPAWSSRHGCVQRRGSRGVTRAQVGEDP